MIKHSCIELVSKDQRKLSIIMSDYDACMQLRDYIRHFAFLDQMVPERQFQSIFARIYFNQIANQKAIRVTTGAAKSLFVDQNMTDLLKLLDLNHDAWSLYTDPLKEFARQGCEFVAPVEQTGASLRHIKHEAHFQIYDNSQYQLCSTYPGKLVFPASADKDIILESAKFRSSQRLPALTYFDKVTGVTIWRCS